MPLLAEQEVAAVVLDLFMPYLSGTQLLPEIVRDHPEVPVIVMTASQEIETAVACMKEGAFDYLVKPVEESRFVSSVKRALEMRALRRQVGALKRSLMTDDLEHGEAFAAIVTVSRKMRSLFQYLEAIAGSARAGADHRRDRHRQGAVGRGGASPERPQRRVRRRQRGGPGRHPVLRHPVRAPQGRLLRCRHARARAWSPGRRRHPVPGRDRRPDAGLPGQAAAPAAGASVLPAWARTWRR